MIRTVVLAQVEPQSWRNGGGVTHELLVWPAGQAWQVRISVARIASNGPFSAYPGVERWFTVLHGEGVVLRFANRRAMLTSGSEPIRFEGAAAPACELLDGPTEDLNLMLRRSAGRGGMAVARAHDPWQTGAALRAVFTQHAATLQVDGAAPLPLEAGTLAHSEQAAQQRWRLTATTSPLRAWWLHFTPFSS